MEKIFTTICFMLLATFTYAQTCTDGSAPVTIPGTSIAGDSVDGEGDPDNTVFTICGFPAGGTLVGLEWTGGDISTVGASWCSEVTLGFGASGSGVNDLFLTLALGEDAPGGPACLNGYAGGSFDILQLGGLTFSASAGGCVDIEIFETFDDVADTPDAMITAGTITLTACPAGELLPIELSKFEGRSRRGHNLLIWETTSEINSDWQILERSLDGRAGWTEIERKRSAGTSTDVQRYEAKDMTPQPFAYYRIRSIDIDGKEEFSHVISIQRDGDVRGLTLAHIGPNPVVSKMSIGLLAEDRADIAISVTDMHGRELYRRSQGVEAGINDLFVNVEHLTSGTYILRLGNEKHSVIQRFTKQ